MILQEYSKPRRQVFHNVADAEKFIEEIGKNRLISVSEGISGIDEIILVTTVWYWSETRKFGSDSGTTYNRFSTEVISKEQV